MKETIITPETAEKDLIHMCVRHSAMRERTLRAERNRAVTAAVALENEIARLKDENELYREIIKNQRWKIFMINAFTNAQRSSARRDPR